METKPDVQEDEDRESFLSRCIPQLIDEGNDQDQAVAICNDMFDRADEENNAEEGGKYFLVSDGEIKAIYATQPDNLTELPAEANKNAILRVTDEGYATVDVLDRKDPHYTIRKARRRNQHAIRSGVHHFSCEPVGASTEVKDSIVYRVVAGFETANNDASAGD